MYPIPETLPISELRHAQAQVIGRLTDGPIVLTQRGKAAAVLVEPSLWNRLLERLEDLDDAVEGLKALAEYNADPSSRSAFGGNTARASVGKSLGRRRRKLWLSGKLYTTVAPRKSSIVYQRTYICES